MRKVILALATVLAIGVVALAEIETEKVPLESIQGDHWTLDLNFRTPQRIVITNKDGTKEVYWYLVYVVTNNTGVARDFIPQAIMFTNNGKVIRDAMQPVVQQQVKDRYCLSQLKNSIEMMSTGQRTAGEPRQPSLKAGADEAQQGIFIFPESDPKMSSFTLFVTGLSGEFIVREVPGAKAGDEPKQVVLRKTMQMTIDAPGDEATPGVNKVVLVAQKWIWR